jgi:hypothetical protein
MNNTYSKEDIERAQIRKEIIKQDHFFSFVKKMPIILAVIVFVASVLLSIELGKMLSALGLFNFGFCALFILGCLLCPVIVYALSKVLLSGYILKIELLKKIALNTTPSTVDDDILKNICPNEKTIFTLIAEFFKKMGLGIACFFKKTWFIWLIVFFVAIMVATVVLKFVLLYELYLMFFVLAGEVAIFGTIIALCCKNK